jgi:hypothetical protein
MYLMASIIKISKTRVNSKPHERLLVQQRISKLYGSLLINNQKQVVLQLLKKIHIIALKWSETRTLEDGLCILDR